MKALSVSASDALVTT